MDTVGPGRARECPFRSKIRTVLFHLQEVLMLQKTQLGTSRPPPPLPFLPFISDAKGMVLPNHFSVNEQRQEFLRRWWKKEFNNEVLRRTTQFEAMAIRLKAKKNCENRPERFPRLFFCKSVRNTTSNNGRVTALTIPSNQRIVRQIIIAIKNLGEGEKRKN